MGEEGIGQLKCELMPMDVNERDRLLAQCINPKTANEGAGELSSESHKSTFIGQQNTGRRTVGFGNHPELDPGNTECVHRHQPQSLLK
jgi:hypothetical protein